MAQTPGPWIVSIDTSPEGHETGYARVYAGDYMNPPNGWCTDYIPTADAHLIAAAPDLLAVIKGLLKSGDMVMSAPSPPPLSAFHAAIRKAEGKVT